jgi:3-hydroxyacyl-CoA dehydrogenase/enoyl-CoA hydratase/3-hydroxybutyryl-CoA epimerase
MIELHTDRDGIATLTFDVPGRPVNAISWFLVDELHSRLDAIAGDSAIRGVIVTSAKPGFMVGADLAVIKDFAAPDVTLHRASELIAPVGRALRRLETLGIPVVAASPGSALGGGLEVLLACHYRIAADVEESRYGLPEVRLGLMPGAGGTQRLPRLIGIAAALPLLVAGTTVPPAQALRLGFLDEVVPAQRLLEAARAALLQGRVPASAPWDGKGFKVPGGDSGSPGLNDLFAGTLGRIRASTQGLQPAPRTIVASVYDGSRLPLDKALRVEQMYFARLVRGSQAQAMVETLFFARQQADKGVSRPGDARPRRFRQVGVLGAGFMGQGIARVAAQHGIDVVLVDRDASTTKKALQILASAVGDSGSQTLSRITIGESLRAFASCDLVIEAVPESLALKRSLLHAVEAVVAPETILASNTSTLPIRLLAQGGRQTDRWIGLHFFSPVHRMNLVEVVVAHHTGPATLAGAIDFVRQIGRTPLVVKDARGFYTSRCVNAYVREGLRMLADGVDPVLIDNAALAEGMPVGPLVLLDEVGVDVVRNIQHASRMAGAPADLDAGSQRVDALLEALFAGGHHGRKAGSGIYRYMEGRRVRSESLPAIRMAACGEPAPGNHTAAEAGERLMAIQMVAASRACSEGVVASLSQADLGAVLGWGFPAHLGGPLRAIRTEGVEGFRQRMQALAARHGPRFEPPADLAELLARPAG